MNEWVNKLMHEWMDKLVIGLFWPVFWGKALDPLWKCWLRLNEWMNEIINSFIHPCINYSCACSIEMNGFHSFQWHRPILLHGWTNALVHEWMNEWMCEWLHVKTHCDIFCQLTLSRYSHLVLRIRHSFNFPSLRWNYFYSPCEKVWTRLHESISVSHNRWNRNGSGVDINCCNSQAGPEGCK